MGNAKKRAPDFAGVLLGLFLIACAVQLFLVCGSPERVEYDYYEGRFAFVGTFDERRNSAHITGIAEDYGQDSLVINKTAYDCVIRSIGPEFLAGSGIRYVKLMVVPETMDDNAFAGTEGVTIYTDYPDAEKEPWAKYVTIRPEKEFEDALQPKLTLSERWELFCQNLPEFLKTWPNSLERILLTVVPLIVVSLLLGKLRVRSARVNPLSYIFKPGPVKWLYYFFTVLAALLACVVLFCEMGDLGFHDEFGWDLYPAEEFLLGWPLYVILGAHAVFALTDLFHPDFPWFISRIVVRLSIVMGAALIGAAAGALVAVIITKNMGLFRLAAFIGLLALLGTIFGVGGRAGGRRSAGRNEDYEAADGYQPVNARMPDGSTVRVDRYSHGTYVGNDQILDESDESMTGESGTIYRK